MRSRLAASIYWLYAGTCRNNTHSIVSSRSIVTSPDLRHCKINRRFQAQGFESPSRPVHSYAIENDDFSDLGPEVSEYCAKQIKLATEKPDCVVKTYPSARELDCRPISSCTRPSPKDILATMGGKSQTSKSKLCHTSSSTDDTKKISNVESSRSSVLVKNIISNVGLSELVEAISVFGKVSGASFSPSSNGIRSCNIEFEDVESSRKAISAGKVEVGSQEFTVHAVDGVHMVAFRIENINEETTDYDIHSRCKTVGQFVGLARTSMDVVDALFNVRSDTNSRNILQKLNKTIIDRNQWSARVVTTESDKSESSEVSSGVEARYKLGIEILDQISELKSQVNMKKIHLEDLEALNGGIMHIEQLPPAVDLSDSK